MAERTRRRRDSIPKGRRQEIANRVLKFYEADISSRTDERAHRLQLYAKYRMWTEGKDWPWEDASDIPLPDMMEKSLRVQDTLHNAVMSQKPPLSAKAVLKDHMPRQESIDELIAYQVFVEQPGEKIVGDLADAFVNDGVFTAFIPWVEERREMPGVRRFEAIPDDLLPEEYFVGLLRQEFPGTTAVPARKRDGWDWQVVGDDDAKPFIASFYTTDDGSVEMVSKREVEIFNGPRILVKDWDDVICPPRCENLQIPGPSNPNGASHVILRDSPTVDAIKRLQRQGYYDLIDTKDIEALGNYSRDTTDDEEEDQKDALQGTVEIPKDDRARSHGKLTLLMCFDCFDIDGDGLDEDVIWWVLKEPKLLLKAKALSELYPSEPPRRPFAEESFLPVRGRRAGISLLELMEGIHDSIKAILDQGIDSGTLRNSPFGFYRASSQMKPEVIRMWPGELYPLGDPSRDVHFPNIGSQNSDAFALNMTTMLNAMSERLTTIGDLQLGRVPAGKSSALRTVGGMALLAGQGEARPERILRRFFMGLAQIWEQIHSLNQHFLPDEKTVRVIGIKSPKEQPYRTISRDAIRGRFDFEFSANVLNTSKEALQGALAALMQTYISGLSVQLGLIEPAGVYRLLRDFGIAYGQDPDRYLSEPAPGALKPKIFAEEAINLIVADTLPDGEPAEAGGAIEHFEKLVAFVQDDNFGILTPEQLEVFKGYLRAVGEKAALQQRQMAAAQEAQQFNQGGGEPGRPAEQPPPGMEQPPVSGGAELLDETMPGAGGGAVQ